VKNYRSIFIVVCIGVLLVSCSGAAKKDDKGKRPFLQQEKFLSTIYDTKPFVIDADRLAPGYGGHNPELLYNSIRLRQEVVKRRPAETSEEHRSRIARDIYTPVMGSIDFDSVCAFRVPPGKSTNAPGRGSVELTVKLTPVFEKGLETPRRAFMVRFQPQLDNSYVITEKNGSRRVIEEKKFSEYAILPVDDAGAPVEERDTFTMTVPMTAEEAKKNEGDLMFLIIGRLQSPYISYQEVNRNPLPGSTGTYLARYHYVHVKIVDIWVYDAASGKIVQKLSHVSGPGLKKKES
jgi:hypothetical protein